MEIQQIEVTGLTDEQVKRSREQFGSNLLLPPAKTPLWKLFARKFTDPLIIVLLVAGMLSISISLYEYFYLGHSPKVFFEPVGVFMAIILATGLAFYFEHQADKEFTLLNTVNDEEEVEVVRNERVTTIARKDIVVGDIVILHTGCEIPADGELLAASSLQVDESSLTGEPLSEKSVRQDLADTESVYPSNHVMRGTKVMEGHGICRVFAVGEHTAYGEVFEAAQIDDSVRTPLGEQLDNLSKWITRLSYAIALAVIVGRLFVFFLHKPASVENVVVFNYVLNTVMIALTLIVVAVPEGLPMAVTLSLAYSMRRMLKTNNLVRQMHACETMGAATVICTDKTGTLTQNRMSVSAVQFYDPSLQAIVDEGIALNTTAELEEKEDKTQVVGNPTEGALLLWQAARGQDYRALRHEARILEELPFSTERKLMATVVESPLTHQRTLYVKGAPEIVLSKCQQIAGNKTREEIESDLALYQSQGMRTLGFAYKLLHSEDSPFVHNDLPSDDLCFLGIVAILDPVREDVSHAVKECHRAGIEIKIVTGDNMATACEIGRQIGLLDADTPSSSLITGPELSALTDEELMDRVTDLKVIARARPMDKKRLVETLQHKGQVVAVTGDGTNDAPALKVAHVGLSMGDGTAVAKEASDITIIGNSFSSIEKAVMWGRSLYQNIQRFLLFQLTVNVSACLIVLFGAFMGTESPLTVTQMLWVNLIMDTFGAMALASLPPNESVMNNKPRNRRSFILNRSMLKEIFGVGIIFFLMLLSFLYVFYHYNVTSISSLWNLQPDFRGSVTPYEQTLLFSIFVWTHFWYMFCSRAFGSGQSIFSSDMSKGFWTIVMVIVLGQLLIVEIFYEFFNVVPLFNGMSGMIDFILIVILSSLVIWTREAWFYFKNSLIVRRL